MKRKNQEAQRLEVYYLSRLRDALTGIPDRDVEEIIQEVHRHIEDAIAELPDEEVTPSQMAGVLEILGPPESFAEKNSAEGTSPLPTIDNDKYKLPVFATLYKAIITIADNFLILFKALLLPSIIICLVSIAEGLMTLTHDGANLESVAKYMDISPLAVGIIILIFTTILVVTTTIFAVTCHRIILLGKNALPNYSGIYFSRRELKYLGWGLLFAVPFAIGVLAINFMFVLLKSTNFEILSILHDVWGIVGSVIVTFIIAPFILVLPATAVEEERPLSKARVAVIGNTVRLAVVLIIPWLITILIQYDLKHVGFDVNNIPYYVLRSLILCVLMVFCIAVLSVSYKTLTYER